MNRHTDPYSISDFSPHLFWDVDRNQLDFERHASQIVKGVLEYGLLKDWKIIYQYYGLKRITEIVIKLKELDSRALFFISSLAGISKQEFRCYITKQLTPPHWNF